MTGSELADIRAAYGFTQPTLATLLGVTATTIHRAESKGHEIRSKLVQDIICMLDEERKERSKHQVRELGKTLTDLIQRGNGLVALHHLMRVNLPRRHAGLLEEKTTA